MRSLRFIYWLGTKELFSLGRDLVLAGLIVWSFSLAVLTRAEGHLQELYNAPIGIVDEDNSALSRHIAESFIPPYFQRPVMIQQEQVDRAMNIGRYTFVVDIPPNFERDMLAGRKPHVQLLVDATAMTLAGLGANAAQQIIMDEIRRFTSRAPDNSVPKVKLELRIAFNPNSSPAWFATVMEIINNITILSIMLAGAAVIREREHGTMDRLLVMPLRPFEIAMSKIWANGVVITIAVALSLSLIVKGLLAIPIAGSIPLFLAGVVVYLFFGTAIGIFLGTVARSMPQLGLLLLLVALPMIMLSGTNTPVESMPAFLRTVMMFSPSTHFVAIAQAILYRGAGFPVVWPHFVAVAAIGGLFLVLSLKRFRKVTAQVT